MSLPLLAPAAAEPPHGPRSTALRVCPVPGSAGPAPTIPTGTAVADEPRAAPAKHTLRFRLAHLLRSLAAWLTRDDRGMSTVEYAIGTLAAAAFAAVLYTVVSGENVVTALTGLVQRALEVAF